MRWTVAWALVLSGAVGCGSSETTTAAKVGPGDGPAPPPAALPDGRPCGGIVTVKLRGAAPGALTAFTLGSGALTARAGGSALPVAHAATGPFELVADAAHPLGAVAPPDGARAVVVSLPLASAMAAGGGAPGALSVCTPPLEFTFDPAMVHPVRCHVVVELALARSIVAGSAPFLLPQFKVRY